MSLYLADKQLEEPIKEENSSSKIGTFFNSIFGTHPTMEQRTNYLTEFAHSL